MSKIQGSYPCTYCHGDPDNACSACDPEDWKIIAQAIVNGTVNSVPLKNNNIEHSTYYADDGYK